jgi:hypothetical protein
LLVLRVWCGAVLKRDELATLGNDENAEDDENWVRDGHETGLRWARNGRVLLYGVETTLV